MKSILVTGGAGFIGSHLVDKLISLGYTVRVLDNLEPQVHGPLAQNNQWPEYQNPKAEYILGDIRDRKVLKKAIEDIDAIYHFAAATGVGQSMYQIAKYSEINIQGTANIFDLLINKTNRVKKVMLSSSRAVYGEGLYLCNICGEVTPETRPPSQLESKSWKLICPICQNKLHPLPTPESKALSPGSFYAITKMTQENICSQIGKAHKIPAIILRFFNVYGPRQSLANPYTGIISTFLQRTQNGKNPEVYEDGLMTRDFVHVKDIVQACIKALDYPTSRIFNIGSGQFTTILEVASEICKLTNPSLKPTIENISRVGDIRHCTADLTSAKKELGYKCTVPLAKGLEQTILYSQQQKISDSTQQAKNELLEAGLLK